MKEIICEKCGKKYRIDETKIKGDSAKLKCKGCDNVLTVTKNAPEAIKMHEPDISVQTREPEDDSQYEQTVTFATAEGLDKNKEKALKASAGGMKVRFGLRGRLFVFFFLIPIALIATQGYLYLQQFNSLSIALSSKSTNIVKQFAEQIIGEKARSVAGQVRLFLESHPNMQPDQFYDDPSLKAIALQPVGKTGYTALYSEPGSDGKWHTWVHANKKIIGSNFDMAALEKPMGSNFPGFWKVYIGVKGNKESQGYYTWLEADGKTSRDKFMVSTPVIGTPYYVAATTYMDEFTVEIDKMKADASQTSKQAQNLLLSISAIVLILIGSITFWYGRSLTSNIKSLTDSTERISMGDLEVKIDIKSKDEIGLLAQALNRMQTSLNMAMARMRKK